MDKLSKKMLHSSKARIMYGNFGSPPTDWVHALLCGRFFADCSRHAFSKKNEQNIFCIHCSEPICQYCLPDHEGHMMIQIRRYVYCDVVRMHEIGKLMDCRGIQNYVVNSAKVIFLNHRPQTKPVKGNSACITCDRTLQDGHTHCSLNCKVLSVLSQRRSLSHLMYKCDALPPIQIRASSPSVKRKRADVQIPDLLNTLPCSSETDSGDDQFCFLSFPKRPRTAKTSSNQRNQNLAFVIHGQEASNSYLTDVLRQCLEQGALSPSLVESTSPVSCSRVASPASMILDAESPAASAPMAIVDMSIRRHRRKGVPQMAAI